MRNKSIRVVVVSRFVGVVRTDRHLSDNLSAIVIADNLLPIIVIARNSFDLSITNIAFVIYFVIADKLSRQTIFYAHSFQTS